MKTFSHLTKDDEKQISNLIIAIVITESKFRDHKVIAMNKYKLIAITIKYPIKLYICIYLLTRSPEQSISNSKVANSI